jgi:hypothetical protein
MNGTMIIITSSGTRTEKPLVSPPTLKELQHAVQGYIEKVPYFDRYLHETGMRDCLVYCNEDGKLKQMPVNTEATRLWRLSATGDENSQLGDILVGHIVILIGDDRFMKACLKSDDED